MTRASWVALAGLTALACAARPTASPLGASGVASSRDVRVFFHGKIHTAATGTTSPVNALAVRGSRIVKTGTDAEVMAAFPSAPRVDLRGRCVVPGFNDAHMHPGADPDAVHLHFDSLDPSIGAVRDAIRKAAEKDPDRWILAEVGTTAMLDASLDRDALDALSARNPVFLRAFYGHGHLLNSRALAALGVDEATPDPPGGRFGRKAGKLDGHAYEYAEWITGRALASRATDAELASRLGQLFGDALRFGITSMQAMTWIPRDRFLAAVRGMKHAPRVRYIQWPMTVDEPLVAAAQDEKATIGGIKWILDGTVLERGAALGFAYADTHAVAPPNFAQPEVDRFFDLARTRHDQILVHAVGGVAVDQALRAAARIPASELAAMRPRIEHGSALQPEQVDELNRRSFVVVKNPLHAAGVALLERRLGKDRVVARFRSLVERGAHVAIGSDAGDIATANPFLNVMMAEVYPYWPEEGVGRGVAVDAYTRESAYAELAERDKGTLEAGKFADFAVLSQDIFTCPTNALPATRSVMTVVGGEIAAGGESEL